MPQPLNLITAVPYAGLSWQLRVECEQEPQGKGITGEKIDITYDKSLAKLRAAGYERHPRLSEVMKLLYTRKCEENLSPLEKGLADEIVSGSECSGEWLSTALERQGNTLISYLDPEGLVWNKSKKMYVKTRNFHFSKKRKFNITKFVEEISSRFIYNSRDPNTVPIEDSQEWPRFDLSEFTDAFVKFHIGCSLAALRGEKRGYYGSLAISLPINLLKDRTIEPVCIGDYYGPVLLPVDIAASRGVITLKTRTNR